MNIRDNFYNALTVNDIEWIPCLAFSVFTLNELMDKQKLSLHKGHKNPEMMAKVSSLGYEAMGFEGMVLPFDLGFEAEAMGCDVELKGNDNGFDIIKSPYEHLIDIEAPDDFTNNARFPVLDEAIDILHQKYDDKDVPILGAITGPFTLLGQLVGVEHTIKHFNNNTVELENALDEITNALIEEIQFYNERDVDAIVMYEPTATSELIEPDLFRKYILPFLEDLADEMEVPGILHICGDTNSNLSNMLRCNFQALSLSYEVDILHAKQLQARINSSTRICGNISNENMLFAKKPKEIYDESLVALESGVDLLAPSCMISPTTGIENIQAMMKARDDFCNYSP